MLLPFRFQSSLFFRRFLVIVIGITSLGIQPQSTVYSSTALRNNDVPRFVEGSCSHIVSKFDWVGADLKRFRCGYLVTWENYDTRNRTIWLAVMETYPKGSKPYPYPIVWLAGGPGGSGFPRDPAKAINYADGFERGWIQFSQRGSEFSRHESELSDAALICKKPPNELTEEEVPGIYHNAVLSNWRKLIEDKPLAWDKWRDIRSAALAECYRRLEQDHGGDYLPAINSKFNALDVIYLIRALGYGNGQANLYGSSYGTLLAQHVIALAPGEVHSVVLDGVAPLGVDWVAEYPFNMRNSLQQIFDACKASAKCAEKYPKLEDTFFELLRQLKDEPLCISVKDGDDTVDDVCLDDYGFLLALGQMLYVAEDVKKVPRIIYGSLKRDPAQVAELGNYYLNYERNEKWPWGMYYSTYCSEFAGFNHHRNEPSQLEQPFQTFYTASKDLIIGICPLYDPKGKSYGDIRIVNTQLPVLIFNGRFDPVTPEKYGQQVAEALSVKDGFRFTSDKGSHGNTGNDCARSIMKAFFKKPEDAPKRDCWDKQNKTPIEFDLVNTGNPGSPLPGPQGPQVPIPDIVSGWIQSVQDWWQQVQEKGSSAWDAFNNWWKEQQEKIANAPEKFWEDLEKRFTEWLQRELAAWLERTLTELMNQCFPAAFLPVGALATVWVARRRKRRRY